MECLVPRRGGGESETGNALEEIYNFEDALAMGMFFNSFFRHADIVKMANLAQFVNVIAPIFTNKEGLFLQPIYFPIAEYAKQRGNIALDLLVSGPTYTPAGGAPLGYLDASASYDPRTRTLYLNVLNRSGSADIAAVIDNIEGRLNGRVELWELNHPDLKATHTFGADRKVRPTTRTLDGAVRANRVSHTFPRHSLTIMKLGLE